MNQQRRLVFGGVAELYERVRPSYPEQLVDDLLTLSGADRALEVGAGTGKATRLFAARGVRVHAVEPSAAMAAVARQSCPGVTVEETDFERFDPGNERFRLLFSAQAWHWIARDLRYVRAREALEPGGLMALFWNRPRWDASPLRTDLLEAYRRADAPNPEGQTDPMHPASEANLNSARWRDEIAGAAGFVRPEMRLYDWSWTYTTEEYLALLQTHSGHIVRPETEQRAILEEVGRAIDGSGGSMRLELVTVLCLATAA